MVWRRPLSEDVCKPPAAFRGPGRRSDLALPGRFQVSRRVHAGAGGMIQQWRPTVYRKAMGIVAILSRWQRWVIGGSLAPTPILRSEADFVRVQKSIRGWLGASGPDGMPQPSGARLTAVRFANAQSNRDGDYPKHAEQEERSGNPVPVHDRQVNANAEKGSDNPGIERHESRHSFQADSEPTLASHSIDPGLNLSDPTNQRQDVGLHERRTFISSDYFVKRLAP